MLLLFFYPIAGFPCADLAAAPLKKFRPEAAGRLSGRAFQKRREVQAARRRALAFRAAGRRAARFTDLRRAAPERLAAVRFIFALRAGFAFFFAIFAIVFLSFSFPVVQSCP
jgi:hypothetical protein